jgi:iron complex transport system substrate-binding protein
MRLWRWRPDDILRSARVLMPFFCCCCLASPATALSVQDDNGNEVILDHAAQRIVSLAPHATELIYEVGAGGQLVGVSDASDFPAAATRLPSVGGAAGFDLERIASLHPDLIVAWASGNSRSQIEALRRLGLAVFESDPKNVDQIATSLTRLGQLTGHAQEGEAHAETFRRAIAALAPGRARLVRVKVFYQVWDPPLYTLGGPHLVTRLIEMCGGTNIFDDVAALAPEVSAEAVLTRQPDLIVTDPSQREAVRASWIARGMKRADEPARVAGIDPDLLTRPTARVAQGAAALCTAIDAARAAKRN